MISGIITSFHPSPLISYFCSPFPIGFAEYYFPVQVCDATEDGGSYKAKYIMNLPKRYTITSALPYANGLKHIGHLAGAYIPADIYVRYLRAQKRDVVFVCGSDEHGTAIPIQATKEGTTPQAIIDKYHVILKENFEDLSISFDVYDRTSSPIHHETAQEFFTYLNDRGEL